jgi:hypothetical protein
VTSCRNTSNSAFLSPSPSAAPAALAFPTPGTRTDTAVVAPSTDHSGRNVPHRTRSSEAMTALSAPTRSGSGERAIASQITELYSLLPVGLGAGRGHTSARPSVTGGPSGAAATASGAHGGQGLDTRPHRPRGTTWQVSLEQVRPTPGAVTLLKVGRRPLRPSPDPLPPLSPDLHQQVARPAADGAHYGWKTTVRRP